MAHVTSALDLALEQFAERRKENKGKRIDNSRLPAGSPMYYHCRYCSTQTDALPESFTRTPKTVCDPCDALTKQGIDLNRISS